MTSGLERALYEICHLLTYLDTHLLTAPGPTRGASTVNIDINIMV